MLGALFALAIAGALLLIIMRRASHDDAITDNNHRAAAGAIEPEHKPSQSSASKIELTAQDNLPPSSNSFGVDAPADGFTEIESILANSNLSFEESATRLLECARREDLPMEVRLDALDHAFNLDRWQAMTLCMEKPLAKPFAERLLSGIHNHGESQKDQVAAAMHLVLHEDEEIRQQAQELLAFLISAEEHVSVPEKLRETANAFLKIRLEEEKEQEVDDGSE